MRVLFLCTGNSARSQIAEVLLNRKGAGRFVAESAGSEPAPRVNPYAIESLERHGYFWPGRRTPRGLDGLSAQDWDLVITVCDRAREACPFFPGQPVIGHWGVPDPAAVTGTEEERRRAFDDTLILLNGRIDLLLALPVDRLSRPALEQRITDIGRQAASVIRPS
jgi:arsenate reductase (thioredoxin)